MFRFTLSYTLEIIDQWSNNTSIIHLNRVIFALHELNKGV